MDRNLICSDIQLKLSVKAITKCPKPDWKICRIEWVRCPGFYAFEFLSIYSVFVERFCPVFRCLFRSFNFKNQKKCGSVKLWREDIGSFWSRMRLSEGSPISSGLTNIFKVIRIFSNNSRRGDKDTQTINYFLFSYQNIRNDNRARKALAGNRTHATCFLVTIACVFWGIEINDFWFRPAQCVLILGSEILAGADS